MTRSTAHALVLAGLVAAVSLAIPLAAPAQAPSDVTIVMSGMLTGPDSVAGTWTATGAIVDSGSYVESARFGGSSIHAVKTLTGARGTITMKADALVVAASPTTLALKAGHWRIVGGTGAYADLKGGGSPVADPGTADLATGAVSVTHRGSVHVS